MEKRWCNACGEAFEPRAQTPRQAYCPKEPCQRERKRLWQQTKRRTDYDYHDNQKQAQQSWRRSHPDYWRMYRERHPDYASANREQQRLRNARRSAKVAPIANSDASSTWPPPAGIFRLSLLDADGGEIGYECTVRLLLVALKS